MGGVNLGWSMHPQIFLRQILWPNWHWILQSQSEIHSSSVKTSVNGVAATCAVGGKQTHFPLRHAGRPIWHILAQSVLLVHACTEIVEMRMRDKIVNVSVMCFMFNWLIWVQNGCECANW